MTTSSLLLPFQESPDFHPLMALGATETEIQAIETISGMPLPAAFTAYLQMLGECCCGLPAPHHSIPVRFQHLVARTPFPEAALIIQMHEDYLFQALPLGIGDDPALWTSMDEGETWEQEEHTFVAHIQALAETAVRLWGYSRAENPACMDVLRDLLDVLQATVPPTIWFTPEGRALIGNLAQIALSAAESWAAAYAARLPGNWQGILDAYPQTLHGAESIPSLLRSMESVAGNRS